MQCIISGKIKVWAVVSAAYRISSWRNPSHIAHRIGDGTVALCHGWHDPDVSDGVPTAFEKMPKLNPTAWKAILASGHRCSYLAGSPDLNKSLTR